jgi:Uri superfamily endonuclease
MSDGYGWDLSKTDPMIIEIKFNGQKVMSLFLGEAMESAGRRAIMRHVKECDNSHWLKKWHMDAMEEVVEILKGDLK